MTQHTFVSTTKDGREVEVMAGWDRPLQGFFMVIEDTNEDSDEGYIFSNFSVTPCHPKTFDVFETVLREQGIAFPNGLLDELNVDKELNLGNKSKDWGRVGGLLDKPRSAC